MNESDYQEFLKYLNNQRDLAEMREGVSPKDSEQRAYYMGVKESMEHILLYLKKELDCQRVPSAIRDTATVTVSERES